MEDKIQRWRIMKRIGGFTLMLPNKRWHKINLFLILTQLLCACSITLPQTTLNMEPIEKEPDIQINITGAATQNLFKIDRGTIHKIAYEEMTHMFTGTGEKIRVMVDLYIQYEWKWVQRISLWPLALPEGEHIAQSIMTVTILDPEPKRYKASSKMRKSQSLWHGWKYDLPIAGGIVRYILRDTLDKMKSEMMLDYGDKTSS